MNIRKRLERLQKNTKPKESMTIKILDLWLEFLKREPLDGNGCGLDIPDYITPPFRNVSSEDYERARKELEDYDRQAEQTTRNLFS